MKQIDVLCVGATSFDLVFGVDHHPLADEKIMAQSLLMCGGGPAANAAVTVARLGLRAAFAGYLGNDVFGNLHLKELQADSVDTSLIVRGEYATPLSAVWVKPDGQRALVNYRAPQAVLPRGSIDFSGIHPGVILFDGHEAEISLPLLRSAKAMGIRTILDAGSLHSGTTKLFEKVDYLVCSRKFAREFSGETDMQIAIVRLAEHHPNVVVTLGADGLIWKTRNGEGFLPAYPVKAVDTTGAGDVFHGAFAAAIARNKTLDYALKFAGAVAALSCTGTGGRKGIPHKTQVQSYLDSVGLENWN